MSTIDEHRIETLTKQRDDLLKALEEYVAADLMACGCCDGGIGGNTQSNAEEAIAKATEAT